MRIDPVVFWTVIVGLIALAVLISGGCEIEMRWKEKETHHPEYQPGLEGRYPGLKQLEETVSATSLVMSAGDKYVNIHTYTNVPVLVSGSFSYPHLNNEQWAVLVKYLVRDGSDWKLESTTVKIEETETREVVR